MRGRIFFHNCVGHAARQFVWNRNVLVSGQQQEAVGEVGVLGCQRLFDIPRDDRRVNLRLVVRRSTTELKIGQCGGIILCGENRTSAMRMRPQRAQHGRAERHARKGRTDPSAFHPQNPTFSRVLKQTRLKIK
jgi:hypothetical protein